MRILDIVLLLCFVPEIILGLVKGFVKQAISLASIVMGVWLASRFSASTATWLSSYLAIDIRLLRILTFAVVVILTILLLYWTGELLTKVIKLATLGWLNRLLGAIFAAVKTLLILGILIMVFEGLNSRFDFVPASSLDSSPVWCTIRDSAGKVFPYLKSLTGFTNG